MQSRNDRFHPRIVSSELENDGTCLHAIAHGDRAAFDRLYRRFYERLFRFCLRVTGRMHLVEDVINETMMVVWRRARDYRASASVSTWIFGIAYRKSLKALARDGRALLKLDEVPPGELSVSAALDFDDVRDAVRRAVAALPPEHRAVIDLTFHFNYSYQEIAQILDCPVGTVKSRMFHARAKLQPLLSQLLGDSS